MTRRINVKYERAAGGDAGEGPAREASLGGLFIETPRPLPVGTLLALEVVAPDGEPKLTLDARILSVREVAALDAPAGMAVRFLDMPEETQSDLRTILAQAQKQEKTLLGVGAEEGAKDEVRTILGVGDPAKGGTQVGVGAPSVDAIAEERRRAAEALTAVPAPPVSKPALAHEPPPPAQTEQPGVAPPVTGLDRGWSTTGIEVAKPAEPNLEPPAPVAAPATPKVAAKKLMVDSETGLKVSELDSAPPPVPPPPTDPPPGEPGPSPSFVEIAEREMAQALVRASQIPEPPPAPPIEPAPPIVQEATEAPPVAREAPPSSPKREDAPPTVSATREPAEERISKAPAHFAPPPAPKIEPPAKKKGGAGCLIIAVLLLGALGAAGFFLRAKLAKYVPILAEPTTPAPTTPTPPASAPAAVDATAVEDATTPAAVTDAAPQDAAVARDAILDAGAKKDGGKDGGKHHDAGKPHKPKPPPPPPPTTTTTTTTTSEAPTPAATPTTTKPKLDPLD